MTDLTIDLAPGIVLTTSEPTAVLAPPVPPDADHRLMYCPTCDQITTWNKSGDAYQCDLCESVLRYAINDAKECKAIDLRESPEARERFRLWCAEMLR